jgi:hypothetical protein
MGILLILTQVALAILVYAAHVIPHVSPWLIWLPGILFAVLWLVGRVFRRTFVLDSFTRIYR